MSARILVVDDHQTNRRLLHERLASEYYQVQLASSGPEALERVRAEHPDIIVLDAMTAGLDGYEVCRRLKLDPHTALIPVLMITDLGREARMQALEAGAEDYLTKPIDETQLFARLRNVVRMKPILDEMRAREASGRRVGLLARDGGTDHGEGARILVLNDGASEAAHIKRALCASHRVFDLQGAEAGEKPDLAIVSVTAARPDGLAIIAHIRSSEATRRLGIVAIADADDAAHAVRALDLGADDLVVRPVDEDELSARVRTLVRRKRRLDALSAALEDGLAAAMLDPLTGLNNRRCLDAKLTPLIARARPGAQPLSLLLIDIDRFKTVNDQFGHAVGDALLRAFAARLAKLVRPLDIVCRFGGEEFVVVMPGTAGDLAALAAERLRRRIAGAPFAVSPTRKIDMTASFGVAALNAADDSASLLERADRALYRAKAEGRNRVQSEA